MVKQEQNDRLQGLSSEYHELFTHLQSDLKDKREKANKKKPRDFNQVMPNPIAVYDALQEFDISIPEKLVRTLYRQFMDFYDTIQYHIMIPTAQQLAATFYIYRWISAEASNSKKIQFTPLMAQIAAGKGKSYVTALTIAFLISRKATHIKHYIIAFHCPEILAKEQSFYDHLFTTFGGYSHALVSTPEALAAELAKVDKRSTLVIHDEADWWWLDACIPVDR